VVACDAAFAAFGECGVSFFTGVPDSLLKSFCAYLSDHCKPDSHVISANEGGSIAIAAGHYLATGELPLVYMQNSGLGNAVNPLISLADADVYGVPMLLLIGWRGEPGKKDEPQHRKMGGATLPLLDAMSIRHAVMPTDPKEAEAVIRKAAATAMETDAPFAIVVPKGAFDAYTLEGTTEQPYSASREDAIDALLGTFPSETAIVSTTGMASRELFELRVKRGESHDADFLTVGSMGHSSQIALGVALGQPGRHVVCLDGDGAMMMHLGALTTVGSLAPKNFTHVLLNNGAHDSVGGQPTVGFDVDLCAVAKACGYTHVASTSDLTALPKIMETMLAAPGPRFLEVRVRTGARSDIGRPTRTPQQCKEALMRFLGE